MDFLPREQVMQEMTGILKKMMNDYQIKQVGIFEEEGKGDSYYLGYTVRNNDNEYMIHRLFLKNEVGELGLANLEWVVETDQSDYHKYDSIDEVFTAISQGQIH